MLCMSTTNLLHQWHTNGHILSHVAVVFQWNEKCYNHLNGYGTPIPKHEPVSLFVVVLAKKHRKVFEVTQWSWEIIHFYDESSSGLLQYDAMFLLLENFILNFVEWYYLYIIFLEQNVFPYNEFRLYGHEVINLPALKEYYDIMIFFVCF